MHGLEENERIVRSERDELLRATEWAMDLLIRVWAAALRMERAKAEELKGNVEYADDLTDQVSDLLDDWECD